MSVAETAKKFADLLKAGNFEDAEKLWAKDIVSLEAGESPMRECRGLEAVKAKGAWWYDNHEVHSFDAEGPFVHGDQFALVFRMDLTQKANGARMQMQEVGLYTVRGGEISEERFFY